MGKFGEDWIPPNLASKGFFDEICCQVMFYSNIVYCVESVRWLLGRMEKDANHHGVYG